MTTIDFLIRKDQLNITEFRASPQTPLSPGEIRVRIDSFALTPKTSPTLPLVMR